MKRVSHIHRPPNADDARRGSIFSNGLIQSNRQEIQVRFQKKPKEKHVDTKLYRDGFFIANEALNDLISEFIDQYERQKFLSTNVDDYVC